MAEQKRTAFVTHKGTAKYPWLNKADTQFDPEGVYKTELMVPLDQAKALMDSCKEVAMNEFGKKGDNAKMPWKTDEETWMLLIKAKSKFQPKFYDTKGNLVTNPPNLFGGSILKIGGLISPYSMAGNTGISLRLTKVQIIEPVSQAGDDGGFDAEEDGYVHDNSSFVDDISEDDPVVKGKNDSAGASSYNF